MDAPRILSLEGHSPLLVQMGEKHALHPDTGMDPVVQFCLVSVVAFNPC